MLVECVDGRELETKLQLRSFQRKERIVWYYAPWTIDIIF